MSMKKIKNLKVIIGVLAVTAIIGVAIAFWSKSPQAPAIPTYTDTDYGFSFAYPEGYAASAFSDLEDTKTILLGGSIAKSGAQVFVSLFDEDITLTVERIKEEMPDLSMFEPQNLSVDGVTGVVFRSTNALDTESRELWFVYNGNLYQISVPVTTQTQPELFDAIIKTWKWSN